MIVLFKAAAASAPTSKTFKQEKEDLETFVKTLIKSPINSEELSSLQSKLRELMKHAMVLCEEYESEIAKNKNRLKEAKFYYDVYHQLYAHDEFFEDLKADHSSVKMCVNSLMEYLQDVNLRIDEHKLPDYFNEPY